VLITCGKSHATRKAIFIQFRASFAAKYTRQSVPVLVYRRAFAACGRLRLPAWLKSAALDGQLTVCVDHLCHDGVPDRGADEPMSLP
jgi:hypothetical protein